MVIREIDAEIVVPLIFTNGVAGHGSLEDIAKFKKWGMDKFPIVLLLSLCKLLFFGDCLKDLDDRYESEHTLFAVWLVLFIAILVKGSFTEFYGILMSRFQSRSIDLRIHLFFWAWTPDGHLKGKA